MSPLRIAPNDSSLAHAMAGRTVGKSYNAMNGKIDRYVQKQTGTKRTSIPKNPLQRMRDLVGDHLISETVTRATGTRAKWEALYLLPHDGGFIVEIVRFDKGHPQTAHVGRIHHHFVARYMQRTGGSSDLSAALPAIKEMAWGAYRLAIIVDRADGGIEVCSRAGAALGDIEDGFVHLKTWVDASTASDPGLRRMCAKATVENLFTRHTPKGN